MALIVRAFAFHADSRAFKYWWQLTYAVIHIVTIPLPNTWKQVRILLPSEITRKTDFTYFSRRGTFRNPHCSTAMSAECRFLFLDFLQRAENTINIKKTTKVIPIRHFSWRVYWQRIMSNNIIYNLQGIVNEKKICGVYGSAVYK